MTLDAWITLVVVVVVVAALAREVLPPAATVLAGTVALLLLGVIDAQQAFAGFSNEAPIIVGSLLILAKAVDISGVLQPVVARLFGNSSGRALLARLLFPVTGFSGFLNNTTIVAMAVPPVVELSGRRGIPVSHLLIPISYAAVLGGVVTAIGTSTNLTVSGLLTQQGMEPLRLFELTPVGLPIAVLGTLALVALASTLLPDRGTPDRTVGDEVRQFTVVMRVAEDGPLDGQTVEAGGLRHLQGVYLAQIERADARVSPVAPEEVLHGGDELIFVGRVDDIVDLQRLRGLVSAEEHQLARLAGEGQAFFEVVVGAESALVGRTIRDIGFRGRYRAAVLAVHRAGQRVDEKIGTIELRIGDTLLLLADRDFRERWRDSRDFLLVAPLSGISPTQPRKALVVVGTVMGFLLLSAFEVVPLLQASLLAVIALLLGGALSGRQARNALDIDILVLIAAAFGLGAAVGTSGLGEVIAEVLVQAGAPLGALGALAGVLLATMLLTELVSNNAAAALLFPICLAVGEQLGVDPRPFVIAVTMGASLSFLTPVGYQTNLMVYGLGNYRFTDFTKAGIPLNLITIALCLTLIPRFFPF
jgi:di/tricarboxylate transporter